MALLPMKFNGKVDNPPSRDSEKWYYPYVRVTGSSIDVETAAEGRYEDYFFEGKGGTSNHIFEFLTTDPIATITDNERHAYGRYLIATLKSNSASGSFSGTVAQAATNASLSVKTAQFNAKSFGILESEMSKLIKISGEIGANSMDTLGEAIEQAISWCVSESKVGKYPPTGVCLIKDNEWDIKRSLAFALSKIKKGYSLEEANEFLDKKLTKGRSREKFINIDPLTIAALYHRFNIPESDNPDREAKDLASDILKNKKSFPGPNNITKGYWYEVEPYRLENGAIPSLLRLVNDPKYVAVNDWPLPQEKLSPPNIQTGSFKVGIQTALRISSSGIADFEANADAKFYGYGFTSEYLTDGLSGSIILDEKYTTGFKVRAKTSDMDANLDLQKLAAKASLGVSSASYEIESLGFNLGALSLISSFVASAVGKFDLNTLIALGSLYNQANEILGKREELDFSPVLTAVKLNLGSKEIQGIIDQEIMNLKNIESENTDSLNLNVALAKIEEKLFLEEAF